MSFDKKLYGLIVPDKTKHQNPVFQASRNIFGNDSESEDDSNKKPVLLRPSDNINRQHGGTRDRIFLVTQPMTDHCESCLTLTITANRANHQRHRAHPVRMSITADVYCEELNTMMEKQAQFQPASINRSAPQLLHDNARHHTAQQTIS
ncbi:hypothetical protein evm_014768 [Chilo suppressalis]|nr:hypothetical protein evm_014768 [Chilo suppressalis]